MSPYTTRPDDATLRQFLLGKLPVDEADPIKNYLEEHPLDAATLDALARDDTFLEGFRQCSRDGLPASASLSDLVARIERLPRAASESHAAPSKSACDPNEATLPPSA